MRTHDEIVNYVASRLKGNIETLVNYKKGEMDIVRRDNVGRITEIYEIKGHAHLGKACGQLYKAKEYFNKIQRYRTHINCIYISQHEDGSLLVRRIR